MSGEPIITTERLELFMPTLEDAKAMHLIVSDPRTGRYLGPSTTEHEHFTRFLRNAGSWLLFGYGGMMVREKGKPELLGNIGIFHSWRGLGEDFDDSPEAGWILAADHVGKGYAAEAMRGVLDWFEREHGKRRVVCMISVGNEASIALAGKLGFRKMRDAELPDGDKVTLFERLPA